MTNSNPVAASVSLADFTESALILPELKGQDPAAVIQELGQALRRTSRVPDFLPFYLAVLNREFLISTALDYGIALPHARLTGLKDLCFAVGRTSKPIHWGSKESPTVRLIFLLAVPSTEAAEYLLLIAGLGRLGKDTAALRGMLDAQGEDEMLNVLRQVKLRQCRGVAA